MTENWNARPIAPSRTAAPAVEVRLDQPLGLAVAELERQFIERALHASSGRVADAAQLLGLSRKGLFLMENYECYLNANKLQPGSTPARING